MVASKHGASGMHSMTIHARYANHPGMLGMITSVIGDAGGDVSSVDIVTTNKGEITRSFTINTSGEEHNERILGLIDGLDSVTVVKSSDPIIDWHIGGKIGVYAKRSVSGLEDLAKAYTPGVGRISMKIHKDRQRVWDLTSKGNTIAVVSDGTSVLGLGNIGPYAALPVMEGKALIFKQFAGIDAWPIVVDTSEPDEVVELVKAIAPGFGGINLEDISAPACFYIEDRLKEELDIPVFHDDQHGTAVSVLAGLMNACKVVKKDLKSAKIAVLGPGAAGTACTKLLKGFGVKDLVVFDRIGAISSKRPYNEKKPHYKWLMEHTNLEGFEGSLKEGLKGVDIFLGVAGPGALKKEWLETMAKDGIVFALSNPIPEILPSEVPKNVRVMATGRSDFCNQINNSVCFPGFFRGLLDARAHNITYAMKIAAANALANVLDEKDLSEELIVPSMFDERVVQAVSAAVQASVSKS